MVLSQDIIFWTDYIYHDNNRPFTDDEESQCSSARDILVISPSSAEDNDASQASGLAGESMSSDASDGGTEGMHDERLFRPGSCCIIQKVHSTTFLYSV